MPFLRQLPNNISQLFLRKPAIPRMSLHLLKTLPIMLFSDEYEKCLEI